MINRIGRNQWLYLALILSLALAMRLTNFVGPVRGDDFRYLALAFDSQYGELNTTVWAGADRFAIFFPISLFYRLFGANQWTSVALPLLASLSTVVLIYFIGSQLKNKETGLVAALIWAVMPLDVLYATQVLPDSIVSAYIAGAILLTLKGFDAPSWKRGLLWVGAGAFCVLAYYTKEISIINSLFCIFAMLIFFIKPKYKRFLDWLRGNDMRVRGFWIISVIIMLILIWNSDLFIVFPVGTPLALLAQNATDFFDAFFLGMAPVGYLSKIPGRVELFDPLLVYLLISIIFLVVRRNKEVFFPLVWMFFLFLVAEWGSESVKLPVRYFPPKPTLVFDRRHLLYMLLPAVLIIGMFLAEALKESKTKKLFLLAAGLTGTTFLVNRAATTEISNMVLEKVFVAAILFGMLLPVFLAHQDKYQNTHRYKFLGLSLLLFGLLFPIGRYHVSDWKQEQALMANLRNAADFLEETDPSIPIITIPGNDIRLNYASDFRLGANWDSIDYIYPDARISEQIAENGPKRGYFIVFEDNANPKYFDAIKPAWEQVAEFGQPGFSGIVIYFNPPSSHIDEP